MVETEYSMRRAYFKARYEAKKAAGQCAYHGCRDVSRPGRVHCDRHAARARSNAQRYAERLRAAT